MTSFIKLSTLFILNVSVLKAQNFSILDSGIFTPQNKKVVLFRNENGDKKLILFQTKLQVNTDGTPISYHPYDLRGGEKAINTLGNAIAVFKKGSNKNLCLDKKTYSE